MTITIERALRLTAGFFVLLSVALGYWVHPAFLLVTAFVGANLLQSGFTNACPGMTLYRRLGLPGGGVVANENGRTHENCCAGH
jgi:hypothetical protein